MLFLVAGDFVSEGDHGHGRVVHRPEVTARRGENTSRTRTLVRAALLPVLVGLTEATSNSSLSSPRGVISARRATAVSLDHRGSYRSRKLTSMVACVGTATPSFMPGLNFHLTIASIAFSSKPKPRL